MFFTQLLTVLSIFTAVRASALPGNSTAGVLSPDLFPIAPMGNVAAVQITTGDTRIFFQDSTGAIIIGGVSAPFLSGGRNGGNSVLVPAGEVLPHTPIIAITANTATYTGARLYFLSRSNVLSEYIYPATIAQNTGGFMGGASCTACLTMQGIVTSSTSPVLYAMANPAFNQFRVGFVSAGQPTTIMYLGYAYE
ncbi:hypothetical protein B0H13DRAFT_1884895 [Mycena leptocephala]|nr:hypothetical protein B0H13DRAFT_1884895 [Mycena leptocephala]